MQRIVLLISWVLCIIHNVSGQFSVAQKDSVLAQLDFAGSSYSLSIYFRPGDYSKEDKKSPYANLSEPQILAKASNTYKDASLYKYLCLEFFQKKEHSTAEKYFSLAVKNYEEWIEKEPNNPVPFSELIELLYGTRSYDALNNALPEGLKRFPKDKDLLELASLIYLDTYKDFEKSQHCINELFAQEPYNLAACTYQIMLYQYQYIIALNQGKTPPVVDISIAEKARKANPKEIGYQHLYHFARVLKAYIAVMERVFQDESTDDDYKKIFDKLNKNEKKIFSEAERFFKSQLKQPKTKNTILNSLGFVSMYLKKSQEAKKYFQELFDANQELSALESLILVNFVEKNWKETERLIEMSLSKFNDYRAYASLLSLYDKYDKNESKKLAVIQKVEQITTSDDTRSLILATWYLKQKNLEKASFYCELLNPETNEAMWRNLALSVLKDDREKAKNQIDKMMAKNPKDKDIQSIKKQLGL
jgi:tetratricopeptide (TPR) repeat protein